MSKAGDLDRFRFLFEEAFAQPSIRTDRFFDVWDRWHLWEERLAGPLFSINEDGQCDYVFAPTETRFPSVRDANSFLNWCLKPIDEYRRSILREEPRSEVEQADQKQLLRQADALENLSRLAYSLMEARL